MANITLQAPSLVFKYILHLPGDMIWVFDELNQNEWPAWKTAGPLHAGGGEIHIPVDIITAARLRLIKPGDDSGLTDEQWAWIRLIGLTGESA